MEHFFVQLKDPGFQLNNGISETYVPIEEQLGKYSDIFYYSCITILMVVAIIFLFNLWRKDIQFTTKIFWSVILLIPLLGLIIYGYWLPEPKKTYENESE